MVRARLRSTPPPLLFTASGFRRWFRDRLLCLSVFLLCATEAAVFLSSLLAATFCLWLFFCQSVSPRHLFLCRSGFPWRNLARSPSASTLLPWTSVVFFGGLWYRILRSNTWLSSCRSVGFSPPSVSPSTVTILSTDFGAWCLVFGGRASVFASAVCGSPWCRFCCWSSRSHARLSSRSLFSLTGPPCRSPRLLTSQVLIFFVLALSLCFVFSIHLLPQSCLMPSLGFGVAQV